MSTQEQSTQERSIRYFPITSFAISMGASGFTIALAKFYHLRWLPEWPYLVMLASITILFLSTLIAYGVKTIHYPEETITDYQHKIRMNFMPTISISILLLSIAYLPLFPLVSIPLWYIGTILHTIVMFHILSKWIHHSFDIQHINPAWFIPVVGNILIPIVGVDCAPTPISAFYLAAGLLFWVILMTILIYRLIFHNPMPEKLIPTLLIILAPPAVGFISYMRITMSFDFISESLLFITYFLFVLILFLSRSFHKISFYISWWAFTFPLAALTIATIVAFQITRYNFYRYTAWGTMLLTAIIITIVTGLTVQHISHHKLCIKED